MYVQSLSVPKQVYNPFPSELIFSQSVIPMKFDLNVVAKQENFANAYIIIHKAHFYL